MSREQFLKSNDPEMPLEKETIEPEEPTEWEKIRDQHLAAKDAFHRARAEANRTGKEKYLDRKYGKRLNNA